MRPKKTKWKTSHATGTGIVGEQEIAEIVSSWTGVPVVKLTEEESDRLLNMEEILHRRVIGQDEAVHAVARAIRRARVGAEGSQKAGRLLYLPGSYRGWQDGAVQGPW